MKIIILAVGKCRSKAVLSLCDDYIKRLKAHWPTSIVEVGAKTSNMDAEKAEIEKYLTKHKTDTIRIIALDESGKSLNSRKFADAIKNFAENNTQTLIFIIGGADGIAPELKAKADAIISLSAMTMPHMLVRPVILEQIYRAATLLTGHPYHRD